MCEIHLNQFSIDFLTLFLCQVSLKTLLREAKDGFTQLIHSTFQKRLFHPLLMQLESTLMPVGRVGRLMVRGGLVLWQ